MFHQIPVEMKTLPTKTNECPTKIIVRLKEQVWYIISVTEEHSHMLSPTKSHMFCRNRKINIHVQKSLQINDEVGVKLNKSYWTFVWEVRGYENLLFMERDVGNFVGQQRCALGKNGDGKTLLSYFARMRE